MVQIVNMKLTPALEIHVITVALAKLLTNTEDSGNDRNLDIRYDRNKYAIKIYEENKHLNVFHFSCECIAGFEGDRCETNIDDCLGNSCQNNATCLDMVEKYKCICPPDYTGKIDFL